MNYGSLKTRSYHVEEYVLTLRIKTARVLQRAALEPDAEKFGAKLRKTLQKWIKRQEDIWNWKAEEIERREASGPVDRCVLSMNLVGEVRRVAGELDYDPFKFSDRVFLIITTGRGCQGVHPQDVDAVRSVLDSRGAEKYTYIEVPVLDPTDLGWKKL